MENHKEKDTIMFDLNGTLEKDLSVTHQIINESLQFLGKEDISSEEMVSEFCFPYEGIFEKAGVKKQIAKLKCIPLFFQFRQKYQDRISLFNDVIPCLEALKQKGIKIGLVTQLPRRLMDEDLQRFGISHYFDAKIAYEDSAEPKPSGMPLLLCMEKLGSKPAKCVYAGDTMFDVLAGRNARVTSVAIYRPFESYNSKLRLLSAKPDLLVMNLNEILKCLN